MIKEYQFHCWYRHNGGPKPRYLDPNQYIRYLMRSGRYAANYVKDLSWKDKDIELSKRIIAFKLLRSTNDAYKQS